MQVLSGDMWSVPANCRAGELQSVLRRRDGDHELIEPKAASVWRALKPTKAALMPVQTTCLPAHQYFTDPLKLRSKSRFWSFFAMLSRLS